MNKQENAKYDYSTSFNCEDKKAYGCCLKCGKCGRKFNRFGKKIKESNG